MLALHVAICFVALLAGAIVLIAFCGARRQPFWELVLLLSTVIISLTGFVLSSPPGTPTPDPARILGVMELAVVVIAALARGRRGTYVVSMVLAVYFNAFVAVTQAFQKISFLHALAPTGKEPAFLAAQLLTLGLFAALAVAAIRHLPSRAAAAAT